MLVQTQPCTAKDGFACNDLLDHTFLKRKHEKASAFGKS